MDRTSSEQIPEDEDEVFMQQYVLSEEDRRSRHPTTRWVGGYRWFRSPNVICLDRYRSSAEMSRIHKILLTENRRCGLAAVEH